MWWWLLGCAPVAEPEVREVVSYVDITAEAGLFGVHWDAVEHPTQCSTGEVLAGAAAAGDFDGDGWTDLWIARMHAPDQLYRNLGNGRFEEIGAQAGVDHAGTSSGGL